MPNALYLVFLLSLGRRSLKSEVFGPVVPDNWAGPTPKKNSPPAATNSPDFQWLGYRGRSVTAPQSPTRASGLEPFVILTSPHLAVFIPASWPSSPGSAQPRVLRYRLTGSPNPSDPRQPILSARVFCAQRGMSAPSRAMSSAPSSIPRWTERQHVDMSLRGPIQ
ncbi:hypothetical protein CPLU01_12177 [Colletotrichum plurivorum]|uniref:Secreted protein n=1 Tax=Colletotrichum plurivorum TaxID=2175906 RepID=A0A8H6JZV2_9PEZI|nr:hypothetical protein CPLU01_12177 [Colletotrichum plurivorum]